MDALEHRLLPSRQRGLAAVRPVVSGLAGLGLLAAVAGWVGGTPSVEAARATPGRSASAPGTMPVDQIKRGMEGYAVTVFKGTQPERFPIRVVDVIRDHRPNQDAILFDSPDPRLQHSGIVGGMSGSPIYIQGKLVGALAFGYRFGKDPLGGITPISSMLDVAELPFRPEVLPSQVRKPRRGSAAWADAMLGLDVSPLPARSRPQDVGLSGGLQPLGLPMSVGGLGAAATQMLVDSFGFTPTRSGKAPADSQPGNHTWKGGDTVSVVLIDGDNAVAPNGTISWVDDTRDRMLAFGHPMFGDGPSNLPFADAHVHTILASLDRSVKLSSHGTIRGTMIQDRQAAISLRTGLTAPMIPVSTRVVGPEPSLPPRVYQNRIAVGLGITPNLVAILIADAVEEAGRDAAEVVAKVRHEFDVVTSRGPRTLTIEDEAFFPQGVEPRLLARARGVVVASVLLENDFEVAEIRRIEQEARVEYGAPAESIMEVRLPQGEIRAGEVVYLSAVLRSFKGDERIVRVPVRIPDDVGGQEIQLEIAGGDTVRPYRPIPSSLDDLLDTLEQFYPSRSLVVSIFRQDEGLATRHGLMPSLPDSVLETLATAGTTRDTIRLKQLARRVIAMPTIIEGEHSFKLDVLPRRTFSQP